MVLLRWCVVTVGAGGVTGGAVDSARLFGIFRVGEERVPSRDYLGRGKSLPWSRFEGRLGLQGALIKGCCYIQSSSIVLSASV